MKGCQKGKNDGQEIKRQMGGIAGKHLPALFFIGIRQHENSERQAVDEANRFQVRQTVAPAIFEGAPRNIAAFECLRNAPLNVQGTFARAPTEESIREFDFSVN
jgi:hypothetical protein